MKPFVLTVGALVAVAMSAAATAPGVSYQYENKFTWDKKQLDSPPLPVGGEPGLAKGLDYPVDLRRRHIEGKRSCIGHRGCCGSRSITCFRTAFAF